jgi:hypothetical protein
VIVTVLLVVWLALALLFVGALCCAASVTRPRPDAPAAGAPRPPFWDRRSLPGEAAAESSGGSIREDPSATPDRNERSLDGTVSSGLSEGSRLSAPAGGAPVSGTIQDGGGPGRTKGENGIFRLNSEHLTWFGIDALCYE